MPFKCSKCNQMTSSKAGSWCSACKGGGGDTVAAEPTPNSAQLTTTEVKTTFGDACAKRYSKDEYWGGGNNEFHVHNYSGPGAHVKCAANTMPKLLDSGQDKFYAYGWKDVLAGVKQIKAGTKSGERSAVCGAIIMFLMNEGELSNVDLRVKMAELVDTCQ